MSSRLDRLFLLLETGSSPLTRKAAALQLGEVQKLHPHELHNLLSKVRKYLHSSTWDTRIAAGQAVEAIISNVPVWDPPGIKNEDSMLQGIHGMAHAGRMKLSQFDIHKVIENGSTLLASEGKEYEIQDISGMDAKERLARQRQMLNKRLGMVEHLGIDTGSIFSNEDIDFKNTSATNSVHEKKRLLSDVYQSEINHLSSGLSSTMLNKVKPKRMLSRDKDISDCMDVEPARKRCRKSTPPAGQVSVSCNESFGLDASHNDNLWEEAKEWPFESFSDELIQDLFSLSWEVRHGAATALREIIKIHGRGAGKVANCPQGEMEMMNQLWLEDMVLRLVCVLALDKFGDFISDQVIAPVRETCAQALGAAISIMPADVVESILSILLQLLFRPEWEARHGGLLGIKYVLAVRKDMKDIIIPLVFDHVCRGLKDNIDDVSAVAASALVPVTNIIVHLLPHKVCSVVASLWDALLDLDDLTASTSSILELLASLLSYKNAVSANESTVPISELVPRLWPFLSHNSSGVRKSVLQALFTLISNKESQSPESWVPSILPVALRLLYQRCLIEPLAEIQDLLYEVWKGLLYASPVQSVIANSFPFLSYWLSMLMQSPNVPIDPTSPNSCWLDIQCKPKEKSFVKERKGSSSDTHVKVPQEYFFIGGNESLSDSPKERERCIMRAKISCAKFLGTLFCVIAQPLVPPLLEGEIPVDVLAKLLGFHLNYKSALQRLAVSLVLSEWAKSDEANNCPLSLKERCLQCLNESIYFDEIAVAFTRVQQDCKDFIALLKHYKVPVEQTYISGSVFTFEQIDNLATVVFPAAISAVKLKPKLIESLDEKRKLLMRNMNQTRHDQTALTVMVQAALAAALVSMKHLPEKLNPVIRPLMDSIKKEESELLQKSSAFHIVQLMELCLSRPNCPNAKIIKNLTTFLCSDASGSMTLDGRQYKDNSIISLTVMQKSAEKVGFRRANSSSRKLESSDSVVDDPAVPDDLETIIRKRGATYALKQAVCHFGKDLQEKLPKLWELVFEPLSQYSQSNNSETVDGCPASQELLCSLQVLEVIGPSVHPDLHPVLESQLLHICFWLEHSKSVVRHLAARCLGVLSRVITGATLNIVLEKLLSRLGATDNDAQRQGVVEGLSCIIDELELKIVPYIVFLIVPLLGRMSDQNEDIRLMATHCFASLVKLMPLEVGIKDPEYMQPGLIDRKAQERHFLEQLLNPKKLEPYEVPVKINAELRSYQQEGVNWLAFLNRYKLHGILCDDMGLGKTLQSICILAGDHYWRDKQYKETQDADCNPLPSLVVCPPTLTGHWVYEVEKFVSRKYLKPLHYTGPPVERVRLRSVAKNYNLLIASYDIVRNDIDFFGTIHWNYCILDEGHVIKNGKTKLARAIKQLSANHRLILSGTPIQNNVLELWSLFDFLMPGFLGTEKQFTARYSKPILMSRDAKSSSKEQEAGVLAMESLHRQVLPFLLRRMKEDVLQDLPPKIIQDYYCDLSSLQVQLYEDFAKSRAKQSVEESIAEGESNNQGASHVFQALQYLRKVCNHPKLVLSPKHPEYNNILEHLKQQKSSLSDIQHAAKLCALRQLLLDCGIGCASGTTSIQSEPEPAVNQHRALIFCQLKGMLDILEKDLFQSLMPSVSYLRLDGSIPPGSRHGVVHRFNNDPSIDVLLLTTQVGGLGLNLTGADTVIFVEHDWNPMKDLQAMDRAHRIGQKKVVNVYRLITRGTLEEKIMGLQKFKLSIANSVINQENSNLQEMGTDQVLDLFTLENKGQKITSQAEGENSSSSKGIKSLLDNLPELWDTDQYDKEYDLDNFLQSLQK